MIDKFDRSHEGIPYLQFLTRDEADRPCLDLDAAYAEMASDEEREAEALEWAEAMIEDVNIDPDDFVYENLSQ